MTRPNNVWAISQSIQLAILALIGWFLAEPLVLGLTILTLTLASVRLTLLWMKPQLLAYLSRNWVKNVTALIFAAFVLSQAFSVGLLNAMVNLLYCGAGLWFFTLPAFFDNTDTPVPNPLLSGIEQLTLLLFFMLATAFIYEQSLLMAAFYTATLLLTMFSLLLVHNPGLPPKKTAKNLMKQVLWFVPLAAILFLVLPNLPPFWKLPEQKIAQTGLDDTMTPGDIANLAQSDRLAFRVNFDNGTPPTQSALYWRAMTLEDFNGKTWRMATGRQQIENFYQAQTVESNQVSLSYNVIAEPTQQRWLYALSGGISPSEHAFESRDNRLLHRHKIKQRLKYQVIHGVEEDSKERLTSRTRQINLALPAALHPKTRALSDQLWQDSRGEPQQFIRRLTAFFQVNDFRYSLQPGQLQGDHIDDFLFNKQVGFCAHFASATAVMMRMQGIPTRIVTGYQGGEYNPNGDYYNVYDRSAHAWIEFWTPDEVRSDLGRWQRFDPTAAVAPERINYNLTQALTETESAAVEPFGLVKSIPWLNDIRQSLQSLDYYWTVWVLDFDQNTQRQLWRDVFSGNVLWPTLALVTAAVLAGLAFLYVTIRSRRPVPWHLVALEKLTKKLTKRHPTLDLTRKTNMTLQSYGQFLSHSCPEHRTQISKIIDLLEFAVYNHSSSAHKRRVLEAISEL